MNLPKGKALLDVGLANLNSTIFGVPLAWGLMFGLALLTGRGFAWDTDSPIQMLAAVTLETAWLPPHYDQLFWMFPAGGYGAAYPVLSGIRPHRTLVLGPLLEKSGSTGVIPGRITRQPMVVPGIVLGGLLLVPDECPTIHQVLNSSIRPETGKAARPHFEKWSSQDWLQTRENHATHHYRHWLAPSPWMKATLGVWR